MIDCYMFRNYLPQEYINFYTSSITPRILLICVLSMLEEVKFRLFLMTALVLGATYILGRRPSNVIMLVIIVVAQFANVGALVLADPAYAALRYLAVGSVWGWLYWRYGWLAAFIGHSTTHLVLDPLLLIGLS